MAENITCCLDWSHTIKNQYSSEINELNRDIEQKRNVLAAMSEKSNNVKRFGLERDIHWMEHLADAPSLLEFSIVERKLLQSKVMIVRGNAGVGKSQLFANAAGKSLRNGVQSLLLLGHTYITDDPISLQIQIVEHRLNSGTSAIALTELLELSFWNTLGLTNGKIQFIAYMGSYLEQA